MTVSSMMMMMIIMMAMMLYDDGNADKSKLSPSPKKEKKTERLGIS